MSMTPIDNLLHQEHIQTLGPALPELLCLVSGITRPQDIARRLGRPARTVRRHLARVRSILAARPSEKRPKVAASPGQKWPLLTEKRPKVAARTNKERARADRQTEFSFFGDQSVCQSVGPLAEAVQEIVPTDAQGIARIRATAQQEALKRGCHLSDSQIADLCRQIAAAAPARQPIRKVAYLTAALPGRIMAALDQLEREADAERRRLQQESAFREHQRHDAVTACRQVLEAQDLTDNERRWWAEQLAKWEGTANA